MLRELYFGKIVPWERHNNHSEEQQEMQQKMEEEEQYFTDKMSSEDKERFQELLQLHLDFLSIEDGDIFSYGFTMGMLIMKDVVREAEAMNLEPLFTNKQKRYEE